MYLVRNVVCLSVSTAAAEKRNLRGHGRVMKERVTGVNKGGRKLRSVSGKLE